MGNIGQMNTTIDIISTEPYKDAEGFITRGDRILATVRAYREVRNTTIHLNRPEEEAWLMPIGQLMDYWECHKQYLGLAKPKAAIFIDDVIPSGLL